MTKPANDDVIVPVPDLPALPDLSRVPVTKSEEHLKAEALLEPCCGNCGYYKPTSMDGKVGICRALPPTPILIGMQPPAIQGRQPLPIVNGFFPLVGVDVCCGAFTQRVTPLPPVDFATVGERQ